MGQRGNQAHRECEWVSVAIRLIVSANRSTENLIIA